MVHRKTVLLLLILFFLFLSCSNGSNSPNYPQLNPVAEYQLSIPEPSGITFGKDYQTFWIVSDGSNGGIYQTTLQGITIEKLPFKGDDIEGISYDHQNDLLWIAEERKKEIVKLDLSGDVLLRKQINVASDSNHGFEGITLLNDGRIWLIHEKSPRMLFMLNHNFSIDNQIVLNDAKDYSGLHYNQKDSTAWIVSDESRLLICWGISGSTFSIHTIPVDKAEGVTADFTNEMIYIVSDKTAKMYLFKIDN